MRVTSAANPRVKQARRLRSGRERRATGRMLVEGERELARAVAAGVAVETLFLCPDHGGAAPPGLACEVVEVSPRVMARLAVRDNAPVVAVARIPERPLARLPRPPRPVYLVADRLEKPGNLGALLRSADGAGVDGVIVCGGDPWAPQAVRASLGTCFTLPLAVAEAEQALAWLGGLPVVVATPEAERLYTEAPLWGAIVVGREDTGVSEPWRRAATLRVRIPMRGAADSLNAAQT
ncbi:MAG: RNA methyltransferase, partial [Nitrospirae bacterium]